jgi:hypothetical protein
VVVSERRCGLAGRNRHGGVVGAHSFEWGQTVSVKLASYISLLIIVNYICDKKLSASADVFITILYSIFYTR